MGENVRTLFHEVAGLSFAEREHFYESRNVPAEIRAEVESLLRFDSTVDDDLPAVVRGAAERFLVSLAPGSEEGRCGPYRLIRLLGNGGMGAVYLAERVDGEVEHQVAIKFVRAGRDLPTFRSRFLRERQILASLNHPGIARLLDAGHTAGHPYLVMEFVEGTPIDQYAADLEVRDILELFIHVADAVSYAHRNLIIHRDLKPSNILVDAAGRPKLLDFGIAKILDAPDETRTVERIMTPEYASPEQLRGGPAATTTDIYSLAAVLQKLLTGRSPRESGNATRQIPRDLASILSMALREEPEERYSSADLLVADLRAYLAHLPVQARRGNIVYHARKFLRRRWLPMAAAFLALVGIGGGLLVANRERAIAERRFQDVRQLSMQFLDLDGDIRVLPGSTKARNRIVSASLNYLGRLASERRPWWRPKNGQDLDLQLEIAEAFLKVARVQGVPINSNLGQFNQASESLAKAEALVEAVLAEPGFPQRRRALHTAAEIARDAMILASSQLHDAEALIIGDKVAERLEAWLAAPGISREEFAAAATIYGNVAQASANAHRLEKAAYFARKGVELSRTYDSNPQRLGKILSVLANTARFSGDLDGALRASREARAIGEKIARPDNSESMLQLAGTLWREGLILGESHTVSFGRPREAEILLQRAFDIAETLAGKDAQDYSSRSYISMAGRELGEILCESDPRRALALYDHSLHRVKEIAGSGKSQLDEVLLLAGSSYALRRLGRTREAGQRIQEALDILRDLKYLPAEKVELGQEADAVLLAQADHYADTGETAAAIRAYEDLHARILKSNPQPEADLRHATHLSDLYFTLGNVDLRAGRVDEGKALYARRLQLWRHWDRKLPGNVFIKRQLAAAELPLR